MWRIFLFKEEMRMCHFLKATQELGTEIFHSSCKELRRNGGGTANTTKNRLLPPNLFLFLAELDILELFETNLFFYCLRYFKHIRTTLPK